MTIAAEERNGASDVTRARENPPSRKPAEHYWLQTPKPPQIFNHHPNIHSPTSAANPRQAQSGRVQRRTLITTFGPAAFFVAAKRADDLGNLSPGCALPLLCLVLQLAPLPARRKVVQ